MKFPKFRILFIMADRRITLIRFADTLDEARHCCAIASGEDWLKALIQRKRSLDAYDEHLGDDLKWESIEIHYLWDARRAFKALRMAARS